MSAERAPWKIVVLALTAVVGLGLAIAGAHAPALNPALLGLGSAAPAAGPLLSEMWYASRAYQVYPAMPSTQTDRALTGFRLSFRDVSPTTEEVTMTDLQDTTTQTATFDRTDRLYFIETRMGDDGFDGETNLSDDGFVLTDAQGHIISR